MCCDGVRLYLLIQKKRKEKKRNSFKEQFDLFQQTWPSPAGVVFSSTLTEIFAASGQKLRKMRTSKRRGGAAIHSWLSPHPRSPGKKKKESTTDRSPGFLVTLVFF